jgi:hypothetical protein
MLRGFPVTAIGEDAFRSCSRLTSVTIPARVTSIGNSALSGCTSLTRVYFAGNASVPGIDVFKSTPATIYYRPGTTGWGTTYAGRPTAVWTDDTATAPAAAPQH